MATEDSSPPVPALLEDDLSDEIFLRFLGERVVAWDIETTGLNWSKDRICTCQLYSPNNTPVIIRIRDRVPAKLALLLSNAQVRKLFHFAMFDLRFMRCHWQAHPRNVSCTKIASKLLGEGKLFPLSHSLKDLLRDTLNVQISKSVQTSDWATQTLSSEQLKYAVRDVLYLPDLDMRLRQELRRHRLMGLASACFRHLPARVELEVRQYSDVFAY